MPTQLRLVPAPREPLVSRFYSASTAFGEIASFIPFLIGAKLNKAALVEPQHVANPRGLESINVRSEQGSPALECDFLHRLPRVFLNPHQYCIVALKGSERLAAPTAMPVVISVHRHPVQRTNELLIASVLALVAILAQPLKIAYPPCTKPHGVSHSRCDGEGDAMVERLRFSSALDARRLWHGPIVASANMRPVARRKVDDHALEMKNIRPHPAFIARCADLILSDRLLAPHTLPFNQRLVHKRRHKPAALRQQVVTSPVRLAQRTHPAHIRPRGAEKGSIKIHCLSL